MLERRGYRLHLVSGRSWEFKTDHIPQASLNDLYKNVPNRCVELHVETNTNDGSSLLARTVKRRFHGICMPALSPADLLLGQGLHLFKHVCSDFSRAAHLLEFRRHVLAHLEDDAFWRELQCLARKQSEGEPGAWCGNAVDHSRDGRFCSSVAYPLDRRPSSRFRAALDRTVWLPLAFSSSFPGSKLYLLLQRELVPVGIPAKRTLRRALLPLRLPPPISPASANDTFPVRLRRYRAQLRYVCFRLRFHLVEGTRYMWELFRWRQHRNSRGRSIAPLGTSRSSINHS